MAICEAPKQRTKILLREAFRNQAETLQKNTQRFGSEEKWKDYLTKHSEGLELFAKEMRVSRKYIKDPKAIREQWPLPGKMIYGNQGRKLPPFLHGSRLRAFREIYESHYGSQSEQAHQRMAALGVAQIVDNPETQWNPGHGESNIASTAILFLTCVISELEHKGRFAPHPRLRELWGYLRDLDDEAKDLWLIRYKATMNRKI
jgi:hypothetical protein